MNSTLHHGASLTNQPSFSASSRLSPLDHPSLRWPQYELDEQEAVRAVLASGRVNSLVHGHQTRAFETEFAAYCGVPHAIAVSNGTVALELAMRALGIGPGDEVIVPSRSFFATAASVVAVGASPTFADIDPVSQTIDIASARAMITERTKAILCVHLGGWVCDMDGLAALARHAGIFLIEDCAQAHGATYRGRQVGSFGDAAAFSFCTDKIISTGGEGGMALFRTEDHWATAWAYKDHGKNPAKVFAPATGHGFRYIHDSFGTNWRLTEMQSAIGRAQLAKLPRWLDRRRRNAGILMHLLSDDQRIEIPSIPVHIEHSFYRLYLLISHDALGDERTTARIIEHMNQAGIPVGSGSCADMSLETAFAGQLSPQRDGWLKNARSVADRTLALPVDHLLDEMDMERMASGLRGALNEIIPISRIRTHDHSDRAA